MANGHGGYREPRQAAPVSGPGAYSARTDGPLRGGPPAPAGGPAGPPGGGMQGPDLSGIVPFGAPTGAPEEPITAGLPEGPGPGGSQVPLAGGLDEEAQERLRSYLPVLVFLASSPDADTGVKQYVRQIRAELG